MKTQINNLINGEKRTIRNLNDEKYIAAKQATSHNGFAGTNREERAAVAAKVAEENNEKMMVSILNQTLTLTRHFSTSGKTWWWSAEINEDLAANFVNTDGNIKSYTLTVNSDCTVDISKSVKRTESSQWRHSLLQPIDEAFVTILEEDVCND